MNEEQSPTDILHKILDAARWAPSGDNAQPWRFRRLGSDRFLVRILQEPNNVYEYAGGQPTLISAGGLLETIRIAAARYGYTASWRYKAKSELSHIVEVSLSEGKVIEHSPLFDAIRHRSVDRRPYRWGRLKPATRQLLMSDRPQGVEIEWYESLRWRIKLASLVRQSTLIRLTIPEAFAVHKRIVDWENPNSPRGIPSKSLGLDALTLKIMQWSFNHWDRARLLNNLGSAHFASLQMDLAPSLYSSAFFAFRLNRVRSRSAENAEELLRVGEAVQRFWLRATSLGLVLQPCLAVLAFAHYGAELSDFTRNRAAKARAVALSKAVERALGPLDSLVFLSRIGIPRSNISHRSTRLPLDSLIEA